MKYNKLMILTSKSFILLVLLLVGISNSHAANMQFLKYSPVASFSSEDFEMLQTTADKALQDNEDGQISEWKNPETGSSGSITPLNTSTIDGMHCRKTKIVNHSKHQSGHSTFTFCKVDKQWKILK